MTGGSDWWRGRDNGPRLRGPDATSDAVDLGPVRRHVVRPSHSRGPDLGRGEDVGIVNPTHHEQTILTESVGAGSYQTFIPVRGRRSSRWNPHGVDSPSVSEGGVGVGVIPPVSDMGLARPKRRLYEVNGCQGHCVVSFRIGPSRHPSNGSHPL